MDNLYLVAMFVGIALTISEFRSRNWLWFGIDLLSTLGFFIILMMKAGSGV